MNTGIKILFLFVFIYIYRALGLFFVFLWLCFLKESLSFRNKCWSIYKQNDRMDVWNFFQNNPGLGTGQWVGMWIGHELIMAEAEWKVHGVNYYYFLYICICLKISLLKCFKKSFGKGSYNFAFEITWVWVTHLIWRWLLRNQFIFWNSFQVRK